jgi:hypothetical protein
MFEIILFSAGLAVGVAFKEGIIAFRKRAEKAATAAAKAYKD